MDKSSNSPNHDLEALSRDSFRSLLGDTRGGIHALLRSNEGLNPMEAVEEMMKIFFIKYFDEINSTQTSKSKHQIEFPSLKVGSTTDPDGFIIQVRKKFEEAKTWEEKILTRDQKTDHSRKIFDEEVQIQLSSTTLMQVFERLQGFSLHQSPAAIKGAIFEDFLGRTFRDDLGQYFTPTEVIELMIRMVHPTEEDIIGDPCCGPARFLTHALKYTHKLYGADTSGKILQVARINCLLNEAPDIDLKKMDSLDPISTDQSAGRFALGFVPEGCSMILTNPPFGIIIDNDKKLEQFSIHKKKKGKIESQVLFIERCLSFLKPNGILGMVVPESILDNKSNSNIREWIYEHALVVAIVSLPLETFKPYGTGIKTAIMFLRKMASNSTKAKDREQNQTFMGTLHNIGYDNSGHSMKSNDIENLIETYEIFKKNIPIVPKYGHWYVIPENQLIKTRFDVKFHELYPLDMKRFQKFCPLTDYVNIIDEKSTPSKKFESDSTKEIFYISIDELENDPFYINDPQTVPAENIGPSKVCQGGDIIVARLGPSLTNRKSLRLDPACKTCYISSEFLVFRVKLHVDPNFVLWLTKSKMFIDQGLAKSSGATPSRYRLHDEFIQNIFVPVYPISEQKKIGDTYLDGRKLIEQRIQEIKTTQNQINPDF